MASSITSEPTSDEPEPTDVDPDQKPSATRSFIEWVVVVGGAVLVALVIKVFVMQAFYIPSESMEKTLIKNDRVLVNKLSYHLHGVERGDVIVFERPAGTATNEEVKDLIKRVIALPGESVVFQDHHVYVDGKLLNEPYLAPGTVTDAVGSYAHKCTTVDPCVIPDNTVWVMGDNRTNSQDSRYIGPIPQDKIIGRAFATVWPLDRVSGL